MQGRTTFVIAHRLSTIRRADQILVVEGGPHHRTGQSRESLCPGRAVFDLYTQQHGLESNLFLAPGESSADGDESAASDDNRRAGTNAKDAGVTDALRLIRGS